MQTMIAGSVVCGIYIIGFLLRRRWAYHAAMIAVGAALFAGFWRIVHQIPFRKSYEVAQGTFSIALLALLLSPRIRRCFYAASCA